MSGERPVELALVGAGWIAERAYLPWLRAGGDCCVKRIFDPERARAQRLAEPLGATVSEDLDRALAPGVEAVLVCSPPSSHPQIIRQALARGHHVLCEKPVVRSATELALATPDGDGGRLMGSAVMRFRPDVARLLGWVRSGRLGRLTRVQAGWWRERGVPGPGTWRSSRDSAPAGVLEDLGPHLIDLVVAALLQGGGPSAVRGCASLLHRRGGGSGRGASWFRAGGSDDYDAPDFCTARVLAGQVLVDLEMAWTDEAPGDLVTIAIEGEEGVARLEGLWGFSTQRRCPEQRVCLEVGPVREVHSFPVGPVQQEDAFRASLAAFAAFCRGRAAPDASFAQLRAVTGWLEAIQRAAGARKEAA
jgi:predicted dehydrogenase